MAKVKEAKSVEVFENCSPAFFREYVYPHRTPAVLKGIHIGDAPNKWRADYLSDVMGEVPVTVHVSPVSKMNFLNKNFLYKSLKFGEFLTRAQLENQRDYFICPEEKYYLRSLGTDPRKQVANISHQFPQLAADISIPDLFEEDRFFSSVFRISSAGIQLWTHYDVMDNILIHVVGRKRVVLFPPNDAKNLYINGDKSEIMDIDNPDLNVFPKFNEVTRYECILEPGDIIFIPALWFHNVIALEYSISVNVFWKHLPSNLYDIKDVYGNKDPVAMQRAIQGVDKALKALDILPDEYKSFYTQMLVSRIEKRL